MSPGCIPALIASTWVGVNGTAFLEKNEVTHIICEYTIQMFRHNRARVVGWKGRIFSAADVNCKIGLRHWPTNWSVPVLEKPGSCLVLFFYCLFAYPRDTIVRTRLNVSTRSRSNWNLKVLVFQEGIKPEYQEKILSEQEWEPTTNSTHKWRRRRETNPHHTGGRRVLSSLGHPCSTPLPLPSLNFRVSLAREC